MRRDPRAHRPRRRLLQCTALAFALTALGALVPAIATAGPSRFIYEACDSALAGGNMPGAKFVVNPGTPYLGGDNCEQPGGSLYIIQNGTTSESASFWNVPIAVTPGGHLDGLTLSGSACGLDGASIAFAYNQGWPANACVEQQHIYHSTEAFSFFWIWLGCNQAGVSCPNNSLGPSIWAHYFAATEVDPTPPTLSNLRGTVLSGAIQRGHQTLGVDAHDMGGGLSRLSVLVNGLPGAEAKAFACNVVEVDNPSVDGPVSPVATPCPSDGKADWTLDTQQYPFRNGPNLVSVCASDYSTQSEPNTTCSEPAVVEVDNTCTASTASDGQALSAQFARNGSDSVTVPFDQGAEVTGRLASEAGDPIPGATICVKMQTLGVDRQSSLVDAVKTDAGGRYSYEVPPGPNREVTLGYRHDSKQVATAVNYFAHARPSLKLSPPRVRNGARIRMWGALPGPQAGKRVVVLQASGLHSDHWLTFRRATTDRTGAFHAAYRFGRTPQRTTYRIRALVPGQYGYPWVQGHSKPARVLVTR